MEAPAVPMKKNGWWHTLTPEQQAKRLQAMKEGKMRAKERRLAAAREPPNLHNDLAEAEAKFAALQVKMRENAELLRKSDEDLVLFQARMNEMELIRADLLREAHCLRNEEASLAEALAARDEHIAELRRAIAAEEREHLALAAAGGGEP